MINFFLEVMDMIVEKIVIIMVGGSGMGVVVVCWLVVDGFKVVVFLFFGKGEVLVQEFGGFGVMGLNQLNDDLKCFVDGIFECWGCIDVLVNSVGYGLCKQIFEIIDEDWYVGFDIYFLNVVWLVWFVVLIMQKQKGGVIINILMVWVFELSVMFLILVVVCVGFVFFIKIFVDIYVVDNICMNNVLFGWIDSFFVIEECCDGVFLKCYGIFEEIVVMVVFFVFDGVVYIIGQNIWVDGGVICVV